MMENKYQRGAEWRKWDLHLHTPSSYDYKDNSVTNQDIIDNLVSNEIFVVAITDHHFIDIERINKLRKLGEAKEITVLPGIEFLSDSRGGDPVHFTAIFSEECNLDYIWGQIKNNTEIKRIEGEGKNPNEVYCNLLETAKFVHELGGIIAVHAGSKTNTIENITHSLPHGLAQKVDIAEAVDIFELGKLDDVEDYKAKVVKFLKEKINKEHPLVLCSDNHNIKDYGAKAPCWIKADPTFKGLLQILNEPEDRVYIGESPDIISRVSSNRTKYIKALSIKPVSTYDNKHGLWFNNKAIPFNYGLVCVIGNKGSGKSAVADIAALCSNFSSPYDFSFLQKKKFRDGKLANCFEAVLSWESGFCNDPINLADNPPDGSIEGVKYLPQGLFEKLTNEITSTEKFQDEIEKVVFEHIDQSEKLGATTFSELISNKRRASDSDIDFMCSEIKAVNKEIIALEWKLRPAYKQELNNKIKVLEDQLKALEEPKPVIDPSKDAKTQELNKEVLSKIEEINTEIQNLETEQTKKEKEKSDLLLALNYLNDFKDQLQIKVKDVDTFLKSHKSDLAKYGLETTKMINVNADLSELNKIVKAKELSLQELNVVLGATNNDEAGSKSIPEKLLDLKNKLVVEQNKLNKEQKKYQQYLEAKKKHDKEKLNIVGDAESPNTLCFYKAEKEIIENEIPALLKECCAQRLQLSTAILRKKLDVLKIYKHVKEKIDCVIKENDKILDDYSIEIDASFALLKSFKIKFLSYINMKKMGTFYSKDGADKQMDLIIESLNLEDEQSILDFLNLLIEALNCDKRDKQNNDQRVIFDQVDDVLSLYDYIFSLDFITYNYQLKQSSKTLEQLSPGERGALLLVFYLLLDSDDKPLIIDQPEDNLDNQSVANILVPFIKMAKNKRQIVIVTHNPNLAVVADADQVIYVKLHKNDNYRFEVVSGSIENPIVNNKIVEVLEGAMPAFNKRKDKYFEEIQ